MGFGNTCGKEFQAEGTAGEPQGRQRETQKEEFEKMWPERYLKQHWWNSWLWREVQILF